MVFCFVCLCLFLCLYGDLQVSISCSHLKDGLLVDHNTFIIQTAAIRRMLLISFVFYCCVFLSLILWKSRVLNGLRVELAPEVIWRMKLNAHWAECLTQRVIPKGLNHVKTVHGVDADIHAKLLYTFMSHINLNISLWISLFVCMLLAKNMLSSHTFPYVFPCN